MSTRLIITGHCNLDDILDYCSHHCIVVLQGRSYQLDQEIVAWQLSCLDSEKLSFLLLKYGTSLTIL
jgi:hypothetical protein